MILGEFRNQWSLSVAFQPDTDVDIHGRLTQGSNVALFPDAVLTPKAVHHEAMPDAPIAHNRRVNSELRHHRIDNANRHK